MYHRLLKESMTRLPTLSAMRPNSESACGVHGRQTIYKSVINNDKHVLSHILPDPLIISGLGDINLHWRLKAMLETFLKDSY